MDIILFLLYALISGGIKIFRTACKFSNFMKYCKVYGYSFDGFYGKIGIGYRRNVPYLEVLKLLTENNIIAVLFPKGFEIFEYLVMIDFPYHEERCGIVVRSRGGIRLFHFYSLVVKEDDQAKCRPYSALYIGEDRGKLINHPDLINGKYLDFIIKASTKDALLELIEEGKYWNGGEKVISKYEGLIQLFLNHHNEFRICEESPCEVKLDDYTNGIYVNLNQKYKENNVNKILRVSIVNIKGCVLDVTKDFEEDGYFNTIFCTIWNEFTKEKVRLSYNLGDDFVKDWKVPSTRLLTDSEIIGALQAYTDNENSTICLTGFIAAYGSVSVEECVNNETGDIEKLCMFTNAQKDRTFVCFSPYLGAVTINEIKENESEFYICCKKEGCFFLCTKESDEYKMENLDTWPYFYEESILEQLLIDLNIKHAFTKYTISNVNDEL